MDFNLRVPLLQVAFLLYHTYIVLSMNGPPIISKKYEGDHTLRVGESLTLRCPLHSQPSPHYKWTKNGELINSGWITIKIRDDVLSIKSVEKVDSGDYVCEATNGFGTEKVEFSVCVRGNNTSTEDEVDYCAVAPTLLHDGATLHQSIDIGVGQGGQLSCAARGKPRPEVKWTKNGNYMSNQNTDRFTFVIHQASRMDQGNYACLIRNSAGSVNRTFTVRVRDVTIEETADEKPWFFPSVMNNATVSLGGTARFSCQVYSRDDRTQIKWVKLPLSSFGLHGSNNITSLMQGEPLQGGPEPSRVGDSFTGTLTIDRVTPADVGVYVCVAINVNGIQFQEALLRLSADSQYSSGGLSSNNDSTQYLPIVVAVGSVTGIVLLALVIWFISRRCASASSSKRTPSSTASTTSSPHNSACAGNNATKGNLSGPAAPPRGYAGYGPVPPGIEHQGALLTGYVQSPHVAPPMSYPLHQQHLIHQQQRLLQQPPPPVEGVQYQYYEQC